MRQTVKPWAKRLGVENLAKRAVVEAQMAGERLKFLLRGRPAPSDAIILASSGRSGSTWLADMLSSVDGVQPIFEPLFPTFSPEVRRLTGWDDRLRQTRSYYLRAEKEDPEWQSFLHAVLTGRSRSYWTDYVRSSWFPDRFLIKLIRGNLMLGYLSAQFAPKIIYLTRHPCAVVYSRLKVNWRATVDDILAQERLVADYLQPWAAEIERERDALGAHAVWWAVENMVPMQELTTRPHCHVSYEQLLAEPQQQVGQVLVWLGLPESELSPELIERPSRMSRRESPPLASASVTERLHSWQQGLSLADQRRILDWAHRLGVTWYNERAVPVVMQKPTTEGEFEHQGLGAGHRCPRS